jgi:hypothetical protein
MSQPVYPRCRWANDNACPQIDLLLVFSIVTCAESIARPTISETLLSPLFRRGSRSNHTPKLILWLGLNVEHPYRASDFVHWPFSDVFATYATSASDGSGR